jgi:ferredoxin
MGSITFMPHGISEACAVGESVFAVGRRAGIEIETACVGQATCGLCRVKILEGEEHLGPLTDADDKHLGNVYFLTRVRLSCQAVVTGDGDVIVELAPKRRHRAGS